METSGKTEDKSHWLDSVQGNSEESHVNFNDQDSQGFLGEPPRPRYSQWKCPWGGSDWKSLGWNPSPRLMNEMGSTKKGYCSCAQACRAWPPSPLLSTRRDKNTCFIPSSQRRCSSSSRAPGCGAKQLELISLKLSLDPSPSPTLAFLGSLSQSLSLLPLITTCGLVQ